MMNSQRIDQLAIDDRHALMVARQEMLKPVRGTFTSEEIASALNSTSSNASQLAADQRSAGKIFGVQIGREWHYPRFQCDRSRKPIEIFRKRNTYSMNACAAGHCLRYVRGIAQR